MPWSQRYVLREAGVGFATTALLLGALLVLGFGASFVRQAEGVGAALLVRLLPELTLLVAPWALPIALLLATTFTFSRLAADNELDAFRASGIPVRRLLPPVLLLALGTTALLSAVVGNWAPHAQHRLRAAGRQGLRDVLLNLSPGPRSLKLNTTRITWSDYRDGEVRDLLVLIAPEGHLDTTFQARRGRLRFDAVRDDLVFDVTDANLLRFDREHGREAGAPPIVGVTPTREGAAGHRWGREYVLVGREYRSLVIPIGEMFERDPGLNDLDLHELWGLRHAWCDNPSHGLALRQQTGRIRPWLLAAHDTERVKRVLVPFAPVFFVLIGAAMGCAARRRSRLQAFAFGLVPVVLGYYLPLQLCETLGREGRWPAELAIGVPHAGLALIALSLAWWRCRR